MKMEKEQAHWIYKTMNEIRFFEEKVHKIFSDGRIPGFVHLYVGEEAVATGVMSQLNDDDYITSTPWSWACDCKRMRFKWYDGRNYG